MLYLNCTFFHFYNKYIVFETDKSFWMCFFLLFFYDYSPHKSTKKYKLAFWLMQQFYRQSPFSEEDPKCKKTILIKKLFIITNAKHFIRAFLVLLDLFALECITVMCVFTAFQPLKLLIHITN